MQVTFGKRNIHAKRSRAQADILVLEKRFEAVEEATQPESLTVVSLFAFL